jgi:hypothetical protein
MEEYSARLYGEARLLLFQSQNREMNDKAPSGGQPTFLMCLALDGSTDHYNEVYPGIIIGDKYVEHFFSY